MEPMMDTISAAYSDLAPAQKLTAEAPRTGKKPNSMGKVFFLVAVAIVIFMAFTAYSVRKEMQGSAQLTAIKDLHFPVLQRLDANIVRIDKMEEVYIEVAVTGDSELTAKAADLATQAHQAFGEIAALNPASAADITKLRTSLQKYQDLATKASAAFLAQSPDIAPMAASMNGALADLRTNLKAFRESSYDSFVQTLVGSQQDARVRLIMGLALGVMNLAFMAVLVYFIRNNIGMMALIAEQNATLEQRVAERTAQLSQKTSDINAMLQNMKLGVSTVVPGNRIHPEYSNYLRTIFGTDDLAGKDLLGTLFSRSTLGVDTKDQIDVALGAILGEEAMMFELNGHLLAREMTITGDDGRPKIVQMDWSPINSERGTIDKVLLITQDVTHLRELELSSAQQREELEIISRIIRISVGKFNDFVESATAFMTANRRLLAQGQDPETVDALFRNMHTIKGNARTFEFTHITDAAHRAEQNYDRLRKDAKVEWSPAEMLAELEAVDSAVARYVKVNEDKLGRKGRASDLLTTRGAFVSNEQLADLRSMAAALASSDAAAEIVQLQKALDQLGRVSLQRIISGTVDSLSSLANELQKPTPTVDVTSSDVAFNNPFAEALKACFMHIVRNSLDHGIEAPAERIRANKPEQGKLRFACERNGDQVDLHISDDGKGLALHTLYEKGLASNVFGAGEQPTREAVADIIFRPGLSTASQVTQVSGRGVGMDAVRTFLKEQGASIRISLQESGTELGFTPFTFVISVPSSAYSH
jgi:HPt (histidine-containing phosphotransfer) domain-containing protein